MTPRQSAVLTAYVRTGSVKEAARDLGMAEQTAKHHLAALRERHGGIATVQLIYLATVAGMRVEGMTA